MADAREAAPRLPEPYAYWQRRMADAKSVLDGLKQVNLSVSDAEMAYGCVSFAMCATSCTRCGYQALYQKDDLDLGHEFMHIHGIGVLLLRLLHREVGIDAPESRRSLDSALIQDLCRVCSDACGEVLKWLPMAVAPHADPA